MISVVILTKNEEGNIGDCLRKVQWAGEIIVVDDGSTDRTVEIAKKNGATVYKRELGGDFSAQRNFGLSKAKGEWVLFVDADERVSNSLKEEIQNTLENPGDINGYCLRREDEIWGKVLKYGETMNVRLLRLGKKAKGEWVRPVHEVWKIEGSVGEILSPLIHYPHQNLSEFLKEINFYSTIRARELYEQNKKTNLMEIVTYPTGKFLQNYLLRKGVLDGMPGFNVSLLMSFHSFLVRSKLYLLWKQEGGYK